MAATFDRRALGLASALVTCAADAMGRGEAGLAAAMDHVCGQVGAILGLLLHGDPSRFDVRIAISAPEPVAAGSMTGVWRASELAEPVLRHLRSDGSAPFTARQLFGDAAWNTSRQRDYSFALWGVDEILVVPVTGGDSYAFFVLGRRDGDFSAEAVALLAAVQPVLSGLVRIMDPASVGDPGLSVVRLTEREQEILGLLAAGSKAAAIARAAGCSERTVHRHLSNIYTKLDVRDRLSATRRAQELGLLASSRASG